MATWRLFMMLYIRKNTSSLFSVNFARSRLLTVNMVADICSIDSVSEKFRGFMFVASCLKYNVTPLLLRISL